MLVARIARAARPRAAAPLWRLCSSAAGTPPKADGAAPTAQSIFDADDAADAAGEGADGPPPLSEAVKSLLKTPEPAAGRAATRSEFQAETKKLLDIVANSLYKDKEVFIRELVSNAADALGKHKHQSLLAGTAVADEPRVDIAVDEATRTFVIRDTGIGMSRQELEQNLGTIARSGTGHFVDQHGADAVTDMIGQFGVGFYSVFTVADRVQVYTRRWEDDAPGYVWTSDGTGSYEINEVEGLEAGTKIVLHLRENESEYSTEAHVRTILRKYSSFVGYPLYINDVQANVVDALWLKDRNSIKDEEHAEFYRFISNAWDAPMFHTHFVTDSPIDIHALMYVPTMQTEKFGMERMQPSVAIYNRKVLIEAGSPLILPEWLRFIKGVVDSADLPLNVSRESLQDSALIQKLNRVLTKRLIRLFAEKQKKDPELYKKFYSEYGTFLKEGVYQDFDNKAQIAPLLMYPTSHSQTDLQTLDDYLARLKPDQDCIYYHVVPSRAAGESSPYFEALRKQDLEVVFMLSPADEFVVQSLREYKDKKFVNVESSDVNKDATLEKETKEAAESLNAGLEDWIKDSLGADKVSTVKYSMRLVNSPALVVDHESANVRRIRRFMDADASKVLPPQNLEINPQHAIIRGIDKVRETNPDLAGRIARQVYDNALVSAGLMDDPRDMLDRINSILEATVEGAETK